MNLTLISKGKIVLFLKYKLLSLFECVNNGLLWHQFVCKTSSLNIDL